MKILNDSYDELARLEALKEYGIDDIIDDPTFERITRLAVNIFDAKMALVTLVEESKQLFAAKTGTELCETDRSSSFCAQALGSHEILEVEDALLDDRFVDTALVKGPPFIRYYAGSPLVSPSGHVLGALCVIDTMPRRPLTSVQREILRALATLVMDKLELRRLEQARLGGQRLFQDMAEASPDAIVCLDERGLVTYWNPAAQRLTGHRPGQVIGKSIGEIAPELAVQNLRLLIDPDPSLAGQTAEIEIKPVSGILKPVEVSASMWREGKSESFCAVLRDATERRRNEARLYRMAHIDALTDLPNRTLLRSRVDAGFTVGSTGCFMMLDLDGFKEINDGFGHPAGDQVLIIVANRLRNSITARDTAARMGGDEFAIFLPEIQDNESASQLAESIINAISEPIQLEGGPVSIGASVGIAFYPRDGETTRDLLSSADLALYEAKTHGKQCHRFYVASLRLAAIAKQAYQTELSRASENSEWTLRFHPQVRMADGYVTGCEAVLYWDHPVQGLLGPEDFMPALRFSPLAADIGNWCLKAACAQLAIWRLVHPDLKLTIQLLDAQFRDGELDSVVEKVLKENSLPGRALQLVVTEAILARNDIFAQRILANLQIIGVPVGLANYGTGRTSLELLKRAPLGFLDLDSSFVDNMENSTADAAIIRAILYLGHALNLGVSAGGVDTRDKFLRLQRKGCDEGRGRYFGYCLRSSDFLHALDAWNNKRGVL